MTFRYPDAASDHLGTQPMGLSIMSAESRTSRNPQSSGTLGAYAAPVRVPDDRRGTFRSERAPVALALIARVDGDARHALDIAYGLAPTVLAVHACDPAESRANSAFIREWEAGNLEVKLVLVAADPGNVGTEVADYIRRSFPRRSVHTVIGATPSPAHTLRATADLADRPAAQLQRALHDLPEVVVHWVMGKRPRR